MNFTQKTVDRIYNGLIVLIIALLALAFFACKTSPEVDGNVPVVVEAHEVVAVPPVSTPQPIPPVEIPEPPAVIPCYPSEVQFANGGQVMTITGFQWGETYEIGVRNIGTCTFNCSFYWSVFDGSTLRWSGECCGFTMEPGSKAINVRIPSFEITPPVCDLAVLTIRTY